MLDSSSENSEPLVFSLVNRPEEKTIKKSNCCCINFDDCCLWWFFRNDIGVLYDDEEMYKDAYCSCFNCCPECLTIQYENCSYFTKQTQFLCCCCSIVFHK